jgi:1-acyl-sn-glycerol-3-phosphate acyltransferase
MPIKWFIPWLFAFPLLKILTGIKINGSMQKKGPCIVACNHASALDPPVIGITACREVYFLAKIGLFNLSKFFTWLIRAYNAIPVTGIQGLRTAVRLLKKGKAVVIFPE